MCKCLRPCVSVSVRVCLAKRERERESMYVCVGVYMCVFVYAGAPIVCDVSGVECWK